MRNLIAFLLLAVTFSGCFGEPKSEPSEKEPPKSMAEKRGMDPVSTPIYAGEDAKAKIDKAVLGNAIHAFQEQESRNPSSLQELVEKKYIAALPKAPVGYQFSYDPQSGAFDMVLKKD